MKRRKKREKDLAYLPWMLPVEESSLA